MQFKSTHLFIILLFTTVSFSTQAQQKFDQWSVSFNYPSDWHITDQEEVAEGSYYLSVEKKGADASGLLVFNLVEGRLEAEDALDTFQQNFEQRISGIKFQKTTAGSFGPHKAQYRAFTFSIMGLEHQGAMYCIKTSSRTLTMIVQEAVEDEAENRGGFQMISESLRIKNP